MVQPQWQLSATSTERGSEGLILNHETLPMVSQESGSTLCSGAYETNNHRLTRSSCTDEAQGKKEITLSDLR